MAIYIRHSGSIVAGEQFDQLREMPWDEILNIRNMLLAATDSYMISDRLATYSAEDQTAITTFRQACRDIPQNYTNENVILPTPPSCLKQEFQHMDNNFWTRIHEKQYYDDHPDEMPEGWTQPLTMDQWEALWA